MAVEKRYARLGIFIAVTLIVVLATALSSFNCGGVVV